MNRLEFLNPDELGRHTGFSHGILAPAGARILFVAGQTAPGAGDLVDQFGGALARVLAVVRDAGARPDSVVRMTVYVTDMASYRAERPRLGGVWRAAMGQHYPAMALVEVRSLVDPNAVVEIEATAVLPGEA